MYKRNKTCYYWKNNQLQCGNSITPSCFWIFFYNSTPCHVLFHTSYTVEFTSESLQTDKETYMKHTKYTSALTFKEWHSSVNAKKKKSFSKYIWQKKVYKHYYSSFVKVIGY